MHILLCCDTTVAPCVTLLLVTSISVYYFAAFCAAVRQVSDLFRNDRKTFSMVARPCRLNGRVERQNIGLERNAVNQRNNLRHLLGAFGNGLHIVGNLPHQLPALRACSVAIFACSLARRVLSALFLVLAAICSMLAAVCTKDADCCSVFTES
jgi:hypothetical protein